MVRKKKFPVDELVNNEKLGYPLGVTYDEKSKYWIICDRNLNKVLLMNVAESDVRVFEGPHLRNPTAVAVFEKGKSVVILCAPGNNQHVIYIYDFVDEIMHQFASHSDPLYNMKSQLRGLAISLGGNVLSLECSHAAAPKRLRIFKRDVGGKGFDIMGAKTPSFIASHNSKVAISDLGNNTVLIGNLIDTDWNKMSFSVLRIIETVSY